MKTVLIPTDFSAASVDLIADVANALPERIEVLLFHAIDMPDSLTEAVLRSGQSSYSKMITEDLRLRCKRLKKSWSNVAQISFRFMYGTTVMAFRNFATANHVDLLYLPAEYLFFPATRDSVNPAPLFKGSGLPFLLAQAVSRRHTSEKTDGGREIGPLGIRQYLN